MLQRLEAYVGGPVVVQQKQIQLGTMRWWVRPLALRSALRIWCGCGCDVGRQLQLRFNP